MVLAQQATCLFVCGKTLLAELANEQIAQPLVAFSYQVLVGQEGIREIVQYYDVLVAIAGLLLGYAFAVGTALCSEQDQKQDACPGSGTRYKVKPKAGRRMKLPWPLEPAVAPPRSPVQVKYQRTPPGQGISPAELA
jgi:hypothetical protein